jgi:hypothetical protein
MVFDVSDIEELAPARVIDDYDELITFFSKFNRSWFKDRNIYVEEHHILPRCEGGSNAKENLICLPYYWHMMAHYLRARYWEERGDQKLTKAHLYGVQCNFASLFSYPDFVEIFLSIPRFVYFMGKNKEELLNKSIAKTKPPKKWMHKGFTNKLIRGDCVQQWESWGWTLGKSKPKK